MSRQNLRREKGYYVDMFNKQKEKWLIKCITENKENVYRIAFSYVKNKEDALDIVQESIYKSLCNVETIRNQESVKSWFYRVVVNTSLDFIRKRKKEIITEDEKLELHIEGAPDHYENMDLVKTLDELPSKYRTVIILRFFEDMKIEEVADVLEVNVNTVKTRLYQALKLIRSSDFIQHYGEE